MKALAGLIQWFVGRVFGAPKGQSRALMPEIVKAVEAISKFGGTRVKEMILALPILLLFVRELLRNRKQLQAQKQLFVIGAAAALSTLGLTVLGGLLSSLPFQIALFFAHPWAAIALFTSGGLLAACVIIVLAWLIIYALTFVLSDDPEFQKVRDIVLTPQSKQMLEQVEAAIEQAGGDVEKLREFASEQLETLGRRAEPAAVEKDLGRMDKLAGKRLSRRARNRRARKITGGKRISATGEQYVLRDSATGVSGHE